MPQDEETLQKLGISGTAAKVYLALLKLGSSTADRIAQQSGTYKANAYQALERLAESGLASSFYEGRKRFFMPTDPEKLPGILEEMEAKGRQRFEEMRQELSNLLPRLEAAYKSIREKELFEIYRGRKAYKALMNEISKEKPQVWKGFGNLQVQEYFPLESHRWFRNVKMLLFSTKTPEVLARLEEAKKFAAVEISWLPKEIFMPVVWVVFGENVLIIIYEPEIIVLRIKSSQVVSTFSNQFEYLWKKYTKAE